MIDLKELEAPRCKECGFRVDVISKNCGLCRKYEPDYYNACRALITEYRRLLAALEWQDTRIKRLIGELHLGVTRDDFYKMQDDLRAALTQTKRVIKDE